MKTKTITLYQFNELEGKAREKVLQKHASINVDHQWWEFTLDDAKRIGLIISEFDTDHYCNGKLEYSLHETCDKIKAEHGQECDTYKLADKYLAQWADLVKKYSDGVKTDQVAEDKEYEFDQEADELEEDFRKALCEEYRIILRKEYEYLTSEEAIGETLVSNEYWFDEDGDIQTRDA